jgi:hypothetical protein
MMGGRMMRPNGGHVSPYTIDVPGRETFPGRWQENPPAPAQKAAFRPGKSLRTGDFALLMAGLGGLGGMVMGIVMGMSQDFTLAPAHAHLNLLGWVTLALYGLYHRSAGRTGGWLGWSQVIAGAAGAVMMSGGLGLYLGSGDDRYAPLVVTGSLFAVLGMILFIALVLIDALSLASPSRRIGASSS